MACRGQKAAVLLLAMALLLISLQSAEAEDLKKPKIPSFEAYNVLLRQGPNSTEGYNTVRCGGSEQRSVPPGAAQFGDVFCFDMPLYKEKDPSSELLGRVQGRYSFSQLTGGHVFVTETFIVNGTSVEYKGSFSALGIEMIGKVSSKPITGGTDDYELVTGNAITTPIPGPLLDQFGNTQFWFHYDFLFS